MITNNKAKLARTLAGVGLIGVGSLSGGYACGLTIGTYLPDAPLIKILICLVLLSSGIYLIVKNKRYASDALQGKYHPPKRQKQLSQKPNEYRRT